MSKKSNIESVSAAISALRGDKPARSRRSNSAAAVAAARRTGTGKPRVVSQTPAAGVPAEDAVVAPQVEPQVVEDAVAVEDTLAVEEQTGYAVEEPVAIEEAPVFEDAAASVDEQPDVVEFEYPDPVATGVVQDVREPANLRRGAAGDMQAIAEGRYRDSFSGRHISVHELAAERASQARRGSSPVKSSVQAAVAARTFKAGISSPSAAARARLQGRNAGVAGHPKVIG